MPSILVHSGVHRIQARSDRFEERRPSRQRLAVPTSDGTRYTGAAEQTLAGIQKWSLGNGTWTYDYTLQSGLGLGVTYQADGLPTGESFTTLRSAAAGDVYRGVAFAPGS